MQGAAHVGATPLFAPLQLAAAAGAWTCLLGPSGVGKSTILRLFAGLGGNVTFDGSFGASDNKPLDGRVALMAQDDLLLPWLSALDNVMIGAKLRGQHPDPNRAHTVLAQVGLTDHATKRPTQLSGGQRQRVALARTLMEDRAVVLLDEPFSALDAKTRARMQDLAVETLQGRTVLLVTHDPAEAARLGDAILILGDTGIEHVPPPPSPAPRAVDDPATLHAQGALLSRLRAS